MRRREFLGVSVAGLLGLGLAAPRPMYGWVDPMRLYYRTDRIALYDQRLRKSIEELGILQPLIVSRQLFAGRYAVVDGHARLAVAWDLRLPRVPVQWVDMNFEEMLAYRTRVNIR